MNIQGKKAGIFNCSPTYYNKNYGLIIQFNVKLTIIKTGLFPSNVFTIIDNECSRYRSDGCIVYYRELHLPVKLLKGVYVRNPKTKESVESLLKEMELSIPVTQM